MNRNYNIVCPNTTKISNNYTNINIDKLSTIVNYSANNIYCNCLNYFSLEQINELIQMIFEKMKPNGSATISIINIKKATQKFIENTLSGEQLLNIFNNIKCILCIEDLYTKIDMNKFKINQVTINDQTIDISIERINL